MPERAKYLELTDENFQREVLESREPVLRHTHLLPFVVLFMPETGAAPRELF